MAERESGSPARCSGGLYLYRGRRSGNYRQASAATRSHGLSLTSRDFYDSSFSNSPSVGLCLSIFFFRASSTTRDPGVIPICARAMAFTALTALNFLGLRFLFAIGHILP